MYAVEFKYRIMRKTTGGDHYSEIIAINTPLYHTVLHNMLVYIGFYCKVIILLFNNGMSILKGIFIKFPHMLYPIGIKRFTTHCSSCLIVHVIHIIHKPLLCIHLHHIDTLTI